ncbi:alpha/beta hydrolase fold/Serine aminopeptidase, S33/Alpha/beta hydrolase family [Leishmania naiffi]|uniref:Alpha/beta hydrolase fold/Serine aminopeptidase, S33/Alpha/beta hydrolase family n=1 Tax=Leishmania naiffi TaxID=5678 RepID=A0AAW3B8P3_9TRYP
MSFGSFLLSAGLYLLLVALFVSLFLHIMSFRYRSQQNRLLYYPQIPPESREVCEDPVALGIPYAERVCVTTADKVRLWGYMLWPGPTSSVEKGSTCSTPDAIGRTSPNVGTTVGGVHVEVDGAGDLTDSISAGSTLSSSNRNASLSSGMPSFVMLYFHGNAGNVGHRLPLAQAFVAHLKCAVMMVDYRGFGLSDDAEQTQETLELDAQACFDYLWKDPRVPRDRIVVMGTSLGGAVSIHLAAHRHYARRVFAVIVENSFSSIGDMASVLSRPILTKLASRCPSLAVGVFDYYVKPLALRISWNSAQKVTKVMVPMLFLSGMCDEIVPPEQMRTLYKAATKCLRDGNGSSLTVPLRRFLEFEEGRHNNLPLMPGYMSAVQEFLTDVRNSGSAPAI